MKCHLTISHNREGALNHHWSVLLENSNFKPEKSLLNARQKSQYQQSAGTKEEAGKHQTLAAKSQRFHSGNDGEEILSMGNHRSRLLWLYFKSKGSATKTHKWEENDAPLIREVRPLAIYSPAFIKNKSKKGEKSHRGKKSISIHHLSLSRSLAMLQTACQKKCIKRCSLGASKARMPGRLDPLNIFRTACGLTICIESPYSRQKELDQTSGLMESWTTYCTKESHNNPQGCQDITNWTSNSPTSDHDWLWSEQRRPPPMPPPSNFQAERYYSPKCITPCSPDTKKDKLNFLEIKVQPKESSRLQSQSKDTERKWPGNKPKGPDLVPKDWQEQE